MRTAESLTFVVAGGALPDGTMLKADGTFTGTARSPGKTTAQVRVCDPGGGCATGELRVDVRARSGDGGPAIEPIALLPVTGKPSAPLTYLGLTLVPAGATLTGAVRRPRLHTRVVADPSGRGGT